MLSLNSHKRKTLHSRTEANAILHKKKGVLQVLFSPRFHYYMTLSFFNPSWGRCRSHPNIQTESFPNCKSFPGQWEMYSFYMFILWSSGFPVHGLSLNSLWAKFGLCLQEWLKDSLAFDKGISFHQVPHIHRV